MTAFAARLGLVAWLWCTSSWALDPDRTIAEFLHTRWTAEQGAPSSAWNIAQTSDGYLWFGTEVGLTRFDGIRFENYEPRRGQFPSRNISALLATPGGGLWIGFRFGGASFLKEGIATTYAESEGLPSITLFGLAREQIGTI
jgi:ligand-binding sensor domain-containing protein